MHKKEAQKLYSSIQHGSIPLFTKEDIEVLEVLYKILGINLNFEEAKDGFNKSFKKVLKLKYLKIV